MGFFFEAMMQVKYGPRHQNPIITNEARGLNTRKFKYKGQETQILYYFVQFETSNSDAYVFAMGNFARFSRRALPNHSTVLDLAKKLSYFKKHWPADLQEDALTDMEETVNIGCLIVAPRTNTLQFKARYTKLQCAPSGTSVLAKKIEDL
ncbi:hypothetical protein B0H13DRAFT_1892395 [Mycena leptocephala]|nr:hypothetical protein B0H13DRAFT_1892395 [Mycena leptocephala]